MRDEQLLALRPMLERAQVNEHTQPDERFQNVTLRPIVKLQNDVILETFRHYITKRKNVFYELTLQRRIEYIEHALYKDQKFRNLLKGMVIGLFTTEEHSVYQLNSSALNKRIMNLIKERLISQIQAFSHPVQA